MSSAAKSDFFPEKDGKKTQRQLPKLEFNKLIPLVIGGCEVRITESGHAPRWLFIISFC